MSWMILKKVVGFSLAAKPSTVNTFALIAINLFVPFAVMVFEINRTFGVVANFFQCTVQLRKNY
jgi:hypothetical protein